MNLPCRERVHDRGADFVDGLHRIDGDQDPALPVVLEQWDGLRVEHREPAFDRSRIRVVFTIGLGASRESLSRDVVGHVEINDGIGSHARGRGAHERALRLCEVTRKAVEEISARVDRRPDRVADDVEDEVVGDQLAARQMFSNPQTGLARRGDVGAEQLAARHVRNVEMVGEEGALGALARAGCTEQDESHGQDYRAFTANSQGVLRSRPGCVPYVGVSQSHEEDAVPQTFDRRRALFLLGAGSGAAVLAACGGGSDDDRAAATTSSTGSPTATASASSGAAVTADMFDAAASCTVAPEQTEGPYYIDVDSIRSDIREDREGTQLRVAARVLAADGCTPIKDAIFEIWHCDAGGLYSGFEAASTGSGGGADDNRYLRGAQVTNADGIAEITTIYPGWYRGRTVHIHAKVFVSNTEVLTTQLYFDEERNDEAYTAAPYNMHTGRDVTNDDDSIFSSETVMTVASDGDGYLGLITLAVGT
jgi:protocatechuate 3,4-dioxygenase beta subunit